MLQPNPNHLMSHSSHRLLNLGTALCMFAMSAAMHAQQEVSGSSTLDSPEGKRHSTDYLIREGDMVQVSVFDEPELTAGGRVRRDGTIQCPLIGSIKIQGLSQLAAARLIEEAYRSDYLVNPEVNLFVSQFTIQRITILGQVQRPGAHELPAEKRLTVLQVLGLAGGPTRIANLKKVLVKRVNSGREEIIKLDVNKMASGEQSMMFYVQEDDVITVPESFF